MCEVFIDDGLLIFTNKLQAISCSLESGNSTVEIFIQHTKLIADVFSTCNVLQVVFTKNFNSYFTKAGAQISGVAFYYKRMRLVSAGANLRIVMIKNPL